MIIALVACNYYENNDSLKLCTVAITTNSYIVVCARYTIIYYVTAIHSQFTKMCIVICVSSNFVILVVYKFHIM